MLVGVGSGLDGSRQTGGFLFALALIAVGLHPGFIGILPGVGVLITGHKGQADAVRLRGGGHAAVLHGRFRFQLLAGGFIGGVQQRGGLGGIGQIGIYQRKPRVCGVEHIVCAVVHAGCKYLWPGQQTVHLGQQPQDAAGQQRHHCRAASQKQHPVAGQPQHFAALPLLIGQALISRRSGGTGGFTHAAGLLFGIVAAPVRRTDSNYIIHPFAICVNAAVCKKIMTCPPRQGADRP